MKISEEECGPTCEDCLGRIDCPYIKIEGGMRMDDKEKYIDYLEEAIQVWTITGSAERLIGDVQEIIKCLKRRRNEDG